MTAASYSIRDLSKEFQVTPRTLRFYEDKQLLDPQRRGTTRIYSERDRTRLRLALRGKRIGFSLEECREIIDMHDSPDLKDSDQLVALCQKICEHRRELLRKIKDVEASLEAMDIVESRCLEQLSLST